ncbi:c-type cytochrome biogenesis protein CcsB [Lysinibacillus sp. KU-BSD001]|uniref:c-type cytochrome biogenesis protein CcsB n=1 Tax=Lysinibacillus sp. KU-BSD001 TaxID=3141328 RepID=UPI0036F18BE5
MSLIEVSDKLLYVAFMCYLIATFLFGGAIKPAKENVPKGASKLGTLAIAITIVGFLSHLGYFITRWMYTGHAPVSNMFEFTTAFGMFLVFSFIIIYFMYKVSALGVVALPIAILIIGYAAMFPSETSPLVPSLQSDFLAVHVITAALGQSILSISAVAGILYLLKAVDKSATQKERVWLEVVMYVCVLVVGFVIASVTFNGMGVERTYQFVNNEGSVTTETYNMPTLFMFEDAVQVEKNADGQYVETTEQNLGVIQLPPLFDSRQFTIVSWSILFGSVLYGLLRLIGRRSITSMVQPLVKRVDLTLVDEIGYRSVLIGFPVFTLGALIFAMMWAQIAWGRYWGWDPKEVWALITWLFYAAFLHLRLSKGWEGKKSAWLAIVGFAIVMFNLVAVNLIIAGLHSYA